MAAGFPSNPSCPSGRPDHPPITWVDASPAGVEGHGGDPVAAAARAPRRVHRHQRRNRRPHRPSAYPKVPPGPTTARRLQVILRRGDGGRVGSPSSAEG
eukprot:3873648-Pyramimonas_sp.AAC.1